MSESAAVRYACPACDFTVFNRRYPKCEHCGATLPESFRYSGEELARLDRAADAARDRLQTERKIENVARIAALKGTRFVG